MLGSNAYISTTPILRRLQSIGDNRTENSAAIIGTLTLAIVISVMANIYSLVVEKPYLTSLCEPMQRVVLRHKSGFHFTS